MAGPRPSPRSPGVAHAVPASRSQAARAIRRSLGKVRCSCTSRQGEPRDVDRLVVGVVLDASAPRRWPRGGSGGRTCAPACRRWRTSSRWCPARGQHPPGRCRSPRPPRARPSPRGSPRPRMCPLGRHHSTRPARLRRAMIAIRAVPPSTSTTTPPADTLLHRRQPRRTCRAGFGTGELMCVTVTSGRVCPRRARAAAGRGGARHLPLAPCPPPTPTVRSCRRPSPAGARPAPADRTSVRRFAAAGHELALVGGPVRDAFLGRTSPDLDFTTDATPDQIRRGCALGRRALGRRPRVRHHRRARGRDRSR